MELAIRLREVIDAAKEKPCADCGNWYARKFGGQMTFDHLDPSKKRFNIGTIGVNDANELGHNLVDVPTLLEEIRKCEVVCRACHNKRERRREEDLRAELRRKEEERRREEECEVWRVFGAAPPIGYRLWLDAFDRLGRILALAHERGEAARASREHFRSWDFIWSTAIRLVVDRVSRGFMSQVFERPKVVTAAPTDRNAWKKLVNPAPRPWKADRGGGT
jgi:hypothetical protein